MSRANYLFTSESVSEGHPDKVCDRISDAVVDLSSPPTREARVACETLPPPTASSSPARCAGPSSVDAGADRGRRRGAPITRHRLRAGRLPLEDRQVRSATARPVGRHRPGRRCRRQQGRGRRRPGHHVRLCLPRDAGADAGADLLRPQDPARLLAEARQVRQARRARPRRQEPGHRPLRGRQAGRGDVRSCSRPSISTKT